MEEVFELGALELQSGEVLPDARLSYSVHGQLNRDRDNVILYPTWAAGRHESNEASLGPSRALDPEKYLVVIPDLFTNGLSSSPSNTPSPFDGPRFPAVTIYDNVGLSTGS